MGMTYEEYWRGPAWLVRSYRAAKLIKVKEEEWARWRQGAYFFDALLCAAPVLRAFTKGDVKPGDYTEEPFPVTLKEQREREEKRDRENYERALAERRRQSAEIKERRKQEEAKENVRD